MHLLLMHPLLQRRFLGEGLFVRSDRPSWFTPEQISKLW
jgi:hypothetical protein